MVKRREKGRGQVGMVVREEGVDDCCDVVEVDLFGSRCCRRIHHFNRLYASGG